MLYLFSRLLVQVYSFAYSVQVMIDIFRVSSDWKSLLCVILKARSGSSPFRGPCVALILSRIISRCG
jgi:hypothetical protein